mgnify:FL=1
MNRPDDSPKNSILIYTTEDGLTKIDTTFDGDTVWLSIDQMAELFQRDKSTISRHIKNIFAEGELERDSVVAKFATTAADGKTYQVEFYNLDVIISVGYRVKSKRGTQFRIWATGILKEYMRKGFALDDERLKNLGGGGYFNEKELRAMGQLVSGYLDFAERQAEREQPMTMQDWANHLDRILTMSGEQLLVGNGTVTHKQAVDKATTEYRKYKARTLSDVEQDYLDSIQFLEQKIDKK